VGEVDLARIELRKNPMRKPERRPEPRKIHLAGNAAENHPNFPAFRRPDPVESPPVENFSQPRLLSQLNSADCEKLAGGQQPNFLFSPEFSPDPLENLDAISYLKKISEPHNQPIKATEHHKDIHASNR